MSVDLFQEVERFPCTNMDTECVVTFEPSSFGGIRCSFIVSYLWPNTSGIFHVYPVITQKWFTLHAAGRKALIDALAAYVVRDSPEYKRGVDILSRVPREHKYFLKGFSFA